MANIFDITTPAGRLTGHVNLAGSSLSDISPDRPQMQPAEVPDIAVWDDSTLVGSGLRKSDLTGSVFRMPLTIIDPDGEDFTFAVEPLISVTSRKIVIKTPMPQLGGTVKEEVMEDDYSITIRGTLINEDNDDYPFDQVAALEALKRRTGGLEVVNKLLNLGFGIMRMTIEQIAYEAQAGSQSMQGFVISAVSDRNVELVISEGW